MNSDALESVEKKPVPRNAGYASRNQNLNEEALVTAARGGHTEAFDQLWQCHAKRILRTACRITRNHADAEDALQDSLLKAFVHIGDFDGRSSFSSWLTRIAINSALMILRKKPLHWSCHSMTPARRRNISPPQRLRTALPIRKPALRGDKKSKFSKPRSGNCARRSGRRSNYRN
jgi:hypothetical protein